MVENEKFRIASKNLFLTYPKCDMEKEAALVALQGKLKIKDYIIAKELHDDGTPHLHCYLELEKKVDIKSPTMLDIEGFHGNYQGAKNKFVVMKYVTKGQDYIQSFDSKQKQAAHDGKVKYIAKELIDGSKTLTQAVSENPELLFQYTSLKKNLEAYKMDTRTVSKHIKRENLWITGKPGIGKSYWARMNYPDLYEKPQNKWWDGYNGQDTVLLDDFDCAQLGHLLKIWGDNYSFYGETKGGTIQPTYTKMIITSNYGPQEMWIQDNQLSAAIERRFKLVTINGNGELEEIK